MPGPKRTPHQREQHYLEISRRNIRGETQTEIAAALGITQQQVSIDFKVVERRWREATTLDRDEFKARELAKIDELERTYWLEWEASKREKQITNTKKVQLSSVDDRTEAALRREQRDGNPSYLAGIQWCIERRCALLGLDAPTKIDIETRIRAAATEMGLDPDDAVQEAQRIISAGRR